MKLQVIALFISVVHYRGCTKNNTVINTKEVERIERTLSADDMQGRRSGTEGSAKAALFIADEFKKAGLQPMAGNSFLQEFSMVQSRLVSVKGAIEGAALEAKNIIVFTSQPSIEINEKSGYQVHHITSGNLRSQVQSILQSGKNSIVFIDTSFATSFSRLASGRSSFKSPVNTILILGKYDPKEFTIKAEQEINEIKLTNVAGILPGRSRKEEQVIFSAHYDHLGIGKPVDGDSIYNGANDDAAGTTAVIMLANHFKKEGNNERTIIFAAFTAEEIGGFGSQYFSQQVNAKGVTAMFNIEMIGTESKWGKASAYITGYDKTDMGTILQQNLQGSGFTFYPDPYPEQQLFYRSDNATMARLGVPAHTISTSKMDSEPNYHKVSDEIKTLDMENMTQIIKAIAASSKSIVSGKDTPTRVKVDELR